MKLPAKITLFVAVPLAIVVAVGIAVGYLFDTDNATALYVRIDDGPAHPGGSGTSTNERYEYRLLASDADGKTQDVAFGSARELRTGAYLRLESMPVRGIVGWEEVPEDKVPAPARDALAEAPSAFE